MNNAMFYRCQPTSGPYALHRFRILGVSHTSGMSSTNLLIDYTQKLSKYQLLNKNFFNFKRVIAIPGVKRTFTVFNIIYAPKFCKVKDGCYLTYDCY